MRSSPVSIPDRLYDYRVNRPVIDFVDGAIDTVEWPSMELRHSAMPERDVLVLTGTEPNWNWRRFSVEVAELEKRLGVIEHVSIGGHPLGGGAHPPGLHHDDGV